MSTINITATTNETTVSASATAITVSAADSSTTLSPTTVLAAYNAGTGLTLSGTTFNVDAGYVTDTANVVAALTAGTNITIASDGTIASTGSGGGGGGTTYTGGTGLTLDGTTFNVDAAQTGITSLGTLTSLTSGTITSNATKLDLTDATTNSSSVYGPTIELYRNGGDGDASSTLLVNSDKLGTIDFYGNNDAGTPEKIKYAKIFSSIYEETDGAESGRLSFSVINAGTHTEGLNPSTILDLEPDVAVFKQDVRIEASASDSGVNASPTPILELYQIDGPTADDGDHLGEIQFTALNDNGYSPVKHKYAGIHAEIIDESNATEDGSLHFTTITAGTEDTTVLTLNGSGSTLSTPLEVNGLLTVNNDTLQLTSTTASSGTENPALELYRNGGSGSGQLGAVKFFGNNNAGTPEKFEYAGIYADVQIATDGSEQGCLKFSLGHAGGQEDPAMALFSYGLQMGYGNPILMSYSNGYQQFFSPNAAQKSFKLNATPNATVANGAYDIYLPDVAGGTLAAINAETFTGGMTVTGGLTASQTIANAVTDTDISVSEFATYDGKKVIYTGGAGSVHLADAVAGDVGKAWTFINAGTGAITVNRATSTQTIKLLNGSSVSAGSANLTVATGGIIEIICTAADNYIAFGSGIS